jgi:hypothetical protein
MKRLIAGPRSLVLVAALAVIAAMCTVSTAHAASASDSVIPAAPSNLTATAVSPDSVRLTWTNNAANQSGVVISLDGVDSVDVQGATVSSYTGDGLSPGTKYWFYIASKIYGTPGDPTGSGNTQSAWVGPVYATTPNTSSSTDWAGSSFCTRYGVPIMGANYKGVAACGDPYVNASSNTQGTISYTTPSGNTVIFDGGTGAGFQCVELVARYFYFQTAQNPPHPAYGSQFANELGGPSYGYNVVPAYSTAKSDNAGTNTFQNSITPGNIISMWSASDSTGHVAVVTRVNVTGGTGTITVMDENALATGTYTITVSNGKMLYPLKVGGYNEFQWTTNLPGSG